VGGAWSDPDWTLRESPFNEDDPAAVPEDGTVGHHMDGVIAGGHFGFNKQDGRWVYGVEVSLSGTDLKETSSHLAIERDEEHENNENVEIDEARVRTELDWLVLGTVRLGYTWDRWLGYVKGGFASGRVKLRGDEEFSEVEGAGEPLEVEFETRLSSSRQHHGWTIGAGVEYMLAPDVILGLEYNRIDLDSRTHRGLATKTELRTDGFDGVDEVERVEFAFRVDPDAIHTVTARLSFKSGCCVAALPWIPLK
jgi:opacity protein-like surface antigen